MTDLYDSISGRSTAFQLPDTRWQTEPVNDIYNIGVEIMPHVDFVQMYTPVTE